MTNTVSRIAALVLLMMIAVPLQSSMAGSRLGVEVGDAECKVLDGPDSDGDLEISIKVAVKNTSETELNVELIVQGLDREGFEAFEFFLSDVLKAGQTRIFTDSSHIKERYYKTIVGWRIEEMTVRGGKAN